MLTIGVNTVAVFKNSEQSFKIFDSHSRDLYGMPDSFGKCTLVCIEGLENVVSFFQMSCPETGAVPFEMKGVRILISAGKKLIGDMFSRTEKVTIYLQVMKMMQNAFITENKSVQLK